MLAGQIWAPDDDGIATGSRLGGMRPCSLGARPGIRWRVFHGCADHSDLLSSSLPGTARAVGKCRVFWFGSRRGAGGVPALPSLPPRNGTGKPGVEWNCNDSRAWYATDRGRIPRRSLSRGTCRTPGRRATPPVTAVSPSHRRESKRYCCDATRAGGEAFDRSNDDAAVRNCFCHRFSQRAAL